MYNRIVELLAQRGKTIIDLKRDTGIKSTTISAIKRRGSNLSTKYAKVVADYLGVHIDDLLVSGDGESKNA